MKRLFIFMLTVMMVFTSASAIGDREARREARYLTDKMAYELGLSSREYDRVYQINLRTSRDLYAAPWNIRNKALRAIFGLPVWQRFVRTIDFYRPAYWEDGHKIKTFYNSVFFLIQNYLHSRFNLTLKIAK